MATFRYSLYLWGFGLLALTASAGWAVWSLLGGRGIESDASGLDFQSARRGMELSADLAPVREAFATWAAPPAQIRGEQWVYELFSPPTLYRRKDPPVWAFDAPETADPNRGRELTAREPAFGAEVVSIGLELFPVQLVGFAGYDDAPFGAFEDVRTREVRLGRNGYRLEGSGFTVSAVEIQRIRGDEEAGSDLPQIRARARIVNSRTGHEVLLMSDHRLVQGAPLACVREIDTGNIRWGRAGDEFSWGRGTYRLDRVESDAPLVELVRSAAGAEPETRKSFTPPLRHIIPGEIDRETINLHSNSP